MSVWARRLATFVPQDAASTRRASCSALDVCSLVYHDTVSSTSSKHWPSPLPDKSVYRSSHRACIGPSDTQINEPSTEYLGRKRSSLDPSWLSPTLNIKEKSLRSPARVDRLSESPVLEFLRPTSLYLTERLSPSTHQHTPLIQGVEPQPGVSLVSQDHLQPPQHPQRRHSFHHLPPATHASHTLGQHSPSAILFSPSTNFLRSPKVTEKGTNRSPFSDGSPLSPCPELSPTNTQFIYQYEEQESARGLAQVKERGAETVSDVRGLKENIQNRNCSERLLDVPQIILNTPETSLPNSVDLETTPASLGLSPTVAAAYHCQKTPGESEGLHTNFQCILALLDEPRSFSPDFNQSRRASWHVFLKNTTDSCHHHPGVQISTRCPSATIHQHTRCLRMGVSPPVGGVIGRGGFGTVKVGRHKGVKVGVKVLRGGRAAASSQREAHALSLPPHAHLASTHALVTPSTTTGYACITWGVTCLNNIKEKNQIVSYEAAAAMFSLPVEDVVRWAGDAREEHGGRPGWAWVVSELCTPLTLLTLINQPDYELTIRTKIRYTSELASGLAYLHSQGLAHLDVKPANALLTYQGHLKLADFGCCTRTDEDKDPVLGTVGYQAPEVLRGEAPTCYSDVFSLGVTIWHLLTRSHPYQGIHPHVVLYQVVHLGHRPPDHHQDLWSAKSSLETLLQHLAEMCWGEEPQQRPSSTTLCRTLTAMLLCSPGTQETYSLVSKLLNL